MTRKRTKQTAIEQLSQYRQKQARLQVLSTYSVGAGITVSRLNEDDQLQELHAKLRGLPSYMYLNKHELKLEQAANAYMTRYPAGIKAQKRAVPVNVMDDEYHELLQELRDKIQKVIAARGYEVRDDIDAVLDRLAEFQDLQADIQRLDFILERLQEYKPYEATLLRWIYIDGLDQNDLVEKLDVSESTIRRRIKKAEREYALLAR
ncbi:RNA polymerase subunit sigma-24 [Paenibacillus sp. 79R4]|uniref:ECF-type sigma factor n=1 Tax=Paenibacillus sp. 79R4 TaxID=2212847 RepID=UPI0015BDDB75|nr:RNA polymerase subunit sigma-24 [Paenibacillus sp. 79R4]